MGKTLPNFDISKSPDVGMCSKDHVSSKSYMIFSMDTLNYGIETPHFGVMNLSHMHGEEERCDVSSIVKTRELQQLIFPCIQGVTVKSSNIFTKLNKRRPSI